MRRTSTPRSRRCVGSWRGQHASTQPHRQAQTKAGSACKHASMQERSKKEAHKEHKSCCCPNLLKTPSCCSSFALLMNRHLDVRVGDQRLNSDESRGRRTPGRDFELQAQDTQPAGVVSRWITRKGEELRGRALHRRVKHKRYLGENNIYPMMMQYSSPRSQRKK